jgi:hypothetical protein
MSMTAKTCARGEHVKGRKIKKKKERYRKGRHRGEGIEREA